jgi:hypothetical protein
MLGFYYFYVHGHFAHSKFVNYELFENVVISKIPSNCYKNNFFKFKMGNFPLFKKIRVKKINMLQESFLGKSSLKINFWGVFLAIYLVLGCYKYS